MNHAHIHRDAIAFVGRSRELTQLTRAVGPGDDGLRTALLRGPSGIGKTTLARAVAGSARELGFRVAIGGGRAAALSTPYAPWLEALPELAPLLADGSPAGTDAEVLGAQVAQRLAALAADAPLLLVFDDVQALDESSLALLPCIGWIDERANVSVLLVQQTDAQLVSISFGARLSQLQESSPLQHVELGPMDDAEIRELLEAAPWLDGADIPAEVLLHAQGNPWFALELATAHVSGNGGEVPSTIAAAATSRVQALGSDEVRDLAYAVALCPEGAACEWLEAMWLERGNPSPFGEALDELIGSGMFRLDARVVDSTHPLMRDAVLQEASAGTRRALHRELVLHIGEQLAAVGDGSDHDDDAARRLAWRRALGFHQWQAGDVDGAVATFVAVGDEQQRLGRPHEAAADLLRALDAEPRVERRLALIRRAAFAAMQVEHPRASECWNELGRIAAVRGDDETYAFALFQQYWTSCDGARIDRLGRAAALGAERLGWSARAAALLRLLEGDYEGAVVHDTVALRIARERGDAMLEVIALEKIGMCCSLIGRIDDAIAALREAVELAGAQHNHHIAVHARTALAELLADRLETEASLVECQEAVRYVESLDLTRYRSMVQAYLALALVRCGRVGEARDVIEQAAAGEASRRHHQFSALVAGVRAHVAVEAGDQLARPVLDAAERLVEEHGFASFVFEVRYEQARHAVLTGDVNRALSIVSGLRIDEPASMARLALWLARAAVRTGNREALTRARALRAGIDGSLPVVRLMLHELDATFDAVDGSTQELAMVVRCWEDAGRPLDAMRARASVGLLNMGAGDDEAAAALREAQLAFARFGALGDSDFLAEHLRRLGRGSRARTRAAGIANLSERELQIARLVADGMRNCDVARQLYLSEKTVAAHLSNIYNKLGIRTRMKVAAWLREQERDLASTG